MNVSKIIAFTFTVFKLKHLRRAGWVKNKIPKPESVAEHSFAVAVLALILAPKVGVDSNKALKMALIHDIGEAEIGDIITIIGSKIVSDPKIKQAQEAKAFKKIFKTIKGDEYIKLFEEFEENKTPEARFVKQIDKLEMALQANEYERDYKKDLRSFFENAENVVTDKYLKTILRRLTK